MVKEYIEKEATINAVTKDMGPHRTHDFNAGCARAVNRIIEIPAADVDKVRHGHWIEQPPDFDLCGVTYYKCSECGKEQQTPSHYCQFCGADMREIKENENSNNC